VVALLYLKVFKTKKVHVFDKDKKCCSQTEFIKRNYAIDVKISLLHPFLYLSSFFIDYFVRIKVSWFVVGICKIF
jgi:hypothetical protein